MKNFILSGLNDIMVAVTFILATKISDRNLLYGCIAFILAYIILDLHSYNDKKLNYPNNLFIH